MNALVASRPSLRAASSPARRPGAVPRNGRRASSVVFASRREYGAGGGGMVDENMIVLRKRIHEMRMAERNYEPPAEWAEWEKRCYATYGADVCEVLGLLQTLLINTRPGVAVGMAALVALSVPTSAALLLCHLAEALRSLLAACGAS